MNVVLLVLWIVQGLHYAKNDNNYRTDLHLPSEQMVLEFRGTIANKEKAKGCGEGRWWSGIKKNPSILNNTDEMEGGFRQSMLQLALES